MRKTYFLIVLILVMVVLCSCQETIQEPNDKWQDESILGDELLGEEYDRIMSLLSFQNGESMTFVYFTLAEIVGLNCYESRNEKIVEMTAVKYGDYILSYLTNENIKEIENNIDKVPPSSSEIYYNGVDDILYHFAGLKEEQIVDCELILYRNNINEVPYRINDKRLVAIWREIILETSDGRQMKVICDTKGNLIENIFYVTDTISINHFKGGSIELGDKFWLFEKEINSYIFYIDYPCYMLDIDEYDGRDVVYTEFFDKEYSPNLENEISKEWLLFYIDWLEKYTFAKELRYTDLVKDSKYWSYWLDYDKVKEALNVE